MSHELHDGRLIKECACGQCPELGRELSRLAFEHRVCPKRLAERDAEARALRRRVAKLRRATKAMLEVCRCENGCPPDDMTCATRLAEAALEADTRAARRRRKS